MLARPGLLPRVKLCSNNRLVNLPPYVENALSAGFFKEHKRRRDVANLADAVRPACRALPVPARYREISLEEGCCVGRWIKHPDLNTDVIRIRAEEGTSSIQWELKLLLLATRFPIVSLNNETASPWLL